MNTRLSVLVLILLVAAVAALATSEYQENVDILEEGPHQGSADAGDEDVGRPTTMPDGEPQQNLASCKEDYRYHQGVIDETESGPTDQRYVNIYEPGSPPNWELEQNVDLNDPEGGTYEVTRYPEDDPTNEHVDASYRLYRKSFEAAKENGWFDYDNALEDGYVDVDGLHHINVNYSFDGRKLDPSRPEQLVYYPAPDDGSRKILAGFMYTTLDEGEQIGGPLTLWHYHPTNSKLSGLIGGIVEQTDGITREEAKRSLEYEDDRRTVEMIHVWFVENPEGPFASTMSVPARCLETPEKMNESRFRSYLLSRYARYHRNE